MVVTIIHKPVDLKEALNLEDPLEDVNPVLLLVLLLQDVVGYANEQGGDELLFIGALMVDRAVLFLVLEDGAVRLCGS